MIKVFAGVCPSGFRLRMVTLAAHGRLHLVRDAAAENEFDIAI